MSSLEALKNICVIILYIGTKCSKTCSHFIQTICKNIKIMLGKTCFQRGFEFFKKVLKPEISLEN